MGTYGEIKGGLNTKVGFGETTTTIGLDLPRCIVLLSLEALKCASNWGIVGISTHITVLSHSDLLLPTMHSIYRASRVASRIICQSKTACRLVHMIEITVVVVVAMVRGGFIHAIIPFSIITTPGLDKLIILLMPPIGQVVVGHLIRRWQSK